jgi:hypothetical protein
MPVRAVPPMMIPRFLPLLRWRFCLTLRLLVVVVSCVVSVLRSAAVVVVLLLDSVVVAFMSLRGDDLAASGRVGTAIAKSKHKVALTPDLWRWFIGLPCLVVDVAKIDASHEPRVDARTSHARFFPFSAGLTALFRGS